MCGRTIVILTMTMAISFGRMSFAEEPSSAPAIESAVKSRYDLPAGGVKELLAFVRETFDFKPTSPAEIAERHKRAYTAMETALEKIAALATDEDKTLEGFGEAMCLRLEFRTIVFSRGPRAGTPEEKQQLIDDIKTTLAASPAPPKRAVSAARKVVVALEYEGDRQQAIEVCGEFGRLLSQSTDPATARDGVHMLGAARRLDLVDKPLEFRGTNLDGTPFDWNKYRGKVVLVEFWATWCGPCLAEFPNVEKNLAAYHDRGFAVVGVSLDEDRKALEKYLAEHPHPWPTVHDGDRLHNPMAVYYGLPGPSACLLVDRAGKVVSIDARGEKLGELLAKLIPVPAALKAAD